MNGRHSRLNSNHIMATFTPEQIARLRQICNTMPFGQLKKYVTDGLLTSTSLLPELNDERRRELDNVLSTMPNPEEARQWEAASASAASAGEDEYAIQQAIDSLSLYIDTWDAIRPTDNHVDEASGLLYQLKAEITERRAAVEENDWNDVWDRRGGSIDALLGHLYKYPYTVHADEIDDAVWSELQRDPDALRAAEEYERNFPKGRHMGDVAAVRNALNEWEQAKAFADAREIRQYIDRNPGSPFANEAQALLAELKRAELERMREKGSAYDAKELMDLIYDNVFTERELIATGILERGDLDMIRDAEQDRERLPDIRTEILRCTQECRPDSTDIYFFGIPSTGKSCILMGLISSGALSYNSAHGGGNYADALSLFVNAGVTIPSTPGDFVATIQSEIITDMGKNKVMTSHVNLVEMSGEEFAFKLSSNENGHVGFKDMGKGAPELLINSNRKIFFIIIDPTATMVRFQHAVQMTDDYGNPMFNEEGKPVMTLRNYNLNQRIMLKRMIDVLMDPENKEIMEKVDAIHFIVTKADILDNNKNGNDRESEAMLRFRANFGSELQRLIRFCRENDINVTRNDATYGHPRLYTFSLGDFKIGGLYRYNPADSEKLVQVIKENTGSERELSWFDKFRRVLSKPIF